MKRLQEQTEKPKKQTVKIIKIICIGLFVLLILEVWLVNRLSTYGDEIQKLKLAQANLELENQSLENEIAQNSSLVLIEKKSSSLGFGSIQNLEYLKPLDLASIY